MSLAIFANAIILLVMQRVNRKQVKKLYRFCDRNDLFALLKKSENFENHFLN